jgi:hypothetical protein
MGLAPISSTVRLKKYMNKYKVIQSANFERCDISGYKQDYEVYDLEGKWCGSWLGAPNGELKDFERRVIIRKKYVTSESPVGAIIKFKKWESERLEEEFLTSYS